LKTKKPIWCLLFIVSALGVYAQRYVAIDYHKDSDHYVIDNRVNVRSAPNISGEKLFQLNAGDKVRILEWNEDGEWLWAEGYYAPWYKISCAKGTGYICGRYVSCKEAVGDLDNDGEDEVFACLCVSESWECEYLTPEVSFLVACSGSKDEENGWYTKRYFYFTDGTLKYLTTLSDVESKMHYGFVEYFEFSNRNTITVMHNLKAGKTARLRYPKENPEAICGTAKIL
jgi:SH3 type 3 domain protein